MSRLMAEVCYLTRYPPGLSKSEIDGKEEYASEKQYAQ